MNKSVLALFVIITVLLIIVVILGLQLLGSSSTNIQNNISNEIACTEEAKICPDGSTVSREGPNCEFAECPIEEDVFCTLDAMQCPDGSYVGRVGPNCEFAACPGE